MKIFVYFLFLLILVSSCKKYKYSKPCSLDFESVFISSNEENKQAKINLTINKITFSGERKESVSVEIEKNLDMKLFVLAHQSKVGINMDIPIGTYQTYSLKIRLSSDSSFTFLKPTTQWIQKPVIINFNDDLDLIFKNLQASMKLEKKKSYVLRLYIDNDLIFKNIDSQTLQWASTMPVNGVNTIVINSAMNTGLLTQIKKNLQEALTLEIVE